jgi:hypothetical protein
MVSTRVPDEPGYGRGIQWIGPTDPGAVGAEQVWWDPTTNTLNVRDAGNAAWVAIAGGTPGLAAVLAVGADAGGAVITGLGNGLSGTDAVNYNNIWLAVLQLVVRHAAGVPAGAPAGAELPIAADTTASPATLYFWTGAAWLPII